MSLRSVLTRRSTVCHLLAVLVTIYGALLRLHCFVEQYGTLDRPAWARVATQTLAPRVAAIAPTFHWTRHKNPYVGGDPITYIEYGRSMTSFYQGHVREPVFLAMTHTGIRALDDQDAGVSLASATGSTLMIYAAYLVGAAVLSPAAGLVAALLTAAEIEIVTWGVDGWRDDTFAAAILFSCWALLRVRARPSFASAIVAGIICGLACLTRITALTFVVPALAWVAIDGERAHRAQRLRMVALASLMAAVVVAPYLISCAIAYGDPLIAINYHTGYYRFAENRPIDQPMSAAEYLRGKFAARPLAMLDTGLYGLFVQPFVTKWHGFGPWSDGLGPVLRAISLSGLAALPFFAAGRLVVVVLLGSLVPYMFTWNVGGGGAWRFTLAAYPIYFVAIGVALVGVWRTIRAVAADRGVVRSARAGIAWRMGTVAVAAALGVLWFLGMPWYVVREAISHGESTSVETGDRDRVFYRSGWSPPHAENITVRISLADRPVIRLPLPERRAYDLVLRLDPIAPGSPAHVDVLFNRHLVGRFPLATNPERVGSYRVRLREDVVSAGSNELILVPSSMTPASSAGERFSWLKPDDRLGVRLWYVRVLP
jgi:hypothetical protein